MEEKEKAVAFIMEHNIPSTLQKILNSLYTTQPGNVYGYLSDELGSLAGDPTLHSVSGFSGVKAGSVSVEVKYQVNNHSAVCEGDVEAEGASLDELKAVNDSLYGVNITDQGEVDKRLSELEGVSNSLKVAISLAVFKTACRATGKSQLDLLKSMTEGTLTSPVPLVSLIGGGKNAPGKNNMAGIGIAPAKSSTPFSQFLTTANTIMDKIEEALHKKNTLPAVTPNGAIFLTVDKIEAVVEIVKEAITEGELGDEVVLVLDVGAPEFHTEVQPGQGSAKKGQTQSTSRHRYDWVEGQLKASEDLCDYLETLVESDGFIALIDPFHPEDTEGYEKLREKVGEKCLVLSRSTDFTSLSTTLTNALTPSPARVLEGDSGVSILGDIAMVTGVSFVSFGGLKGRVDAYNRVLRRTQQVEGIKSAVPEWKFEERKVEVEGAGEEEKTEA
eukprot:sb/3464715/